ncbi:hypothetical protein [Enterococcus faecium]|uniref:hypothetical protein n=1 Tax=Enterococcus faecium TaxID=1352 RepID=UPI000FFCA167|nr:hypothetical protein [Enterococcus faecium]RXD18434.1 hypothetical protein EAS65_14190 [Enterococcus faecium]
MLKLGKALKELVPIVVALLAALFTSILPVNFKFIPSDKIYGINLTIYSALFTAIFKGLFYLGSLFKNRKTFVKITFSDKNTNFKEIDEIQYDFEPDVDMTKVYFKVYLEGNPKKFINKNIEILLPMQVEAYPIDQYSDDCNISNDKKQITIDINKLFNRNKVKRIKDSKILGFKVLKNYPEVDSGLEVSIKNNKKNKIKLINNKGIFRK